MSYFIAACVVTPMLFVYYWHISLPKPKSQSLIFEGENTDTLHVRVSQGEGEFRFKLEVNRSTNILFLNDNGYTTNKLYHRIKIEPY